MIINQQIKIKLVFLAHNKTENGAAHQIAQHIRYGICHPGTLLPSVAMWYIPNPLYGVPNPAFKKEMNERSKIK